jgi:hypothetical protein
MFKWFKKKPAPRHRSVIVYLADGTCHGHKAMYRTIRNSGVLCLHDGDGGGRVVADYAAGSWISINVIEEEDEE